MVLIIIMGSVELLKTTTGVPMERIMCQGRMDHSMPFVQDKFEILNKFYILKDLVNIHYFGM